MADGDYERPEKRKAELERMKKALENLKKSRNSDSVAQCHKD